MREKMSKQSPPAPTVSTVGPCPTINQISRTPQHWKRNNHTLYIFVIEAVELSNSFIVQSNFNGSSTFGTMKICLRQGVGLDNEC